MVADRFRDKVVLGVLLRQALQRLNRLGRIGLHDHATVLICCSTLFVSDIDLTLANLPRR